MIKKGILILLTGFFLTGCATTGSVSKLGASKKDISKLPTFDIPVVVNDRVVAWIDYFQGAGRRHFERYLARSGRYIPIMQEYLRKYNLPQDLVYLALIESGYSAKAYSRAGASGHWQFMNGTGKMYGLAINTWKDERRDPEKATIAAARFLKDLYEQFGDWYLALAAYNAGPGKISRAIQRNGTKDFFEMIEKDRRFLRPETKDYVPKFLAAAIIAKSPERFGFGDVVYEKPIEAELVKIPSQTDFDVIAKCSGVTVNIIEDLNPELKHGTTPPDAPDYEIFLPKGTAKKFEVAYAKVPESERVTVIRYAVHRGDSAAKVARKFGLSVRELLAANDLTRVSQVRKGMTLIIPTGGEARALAVVAANDNNSGASESGTGRLLKHRVRKGESLTTIASNYDVSLSQLKKWNGIKSNHVRKGQLIKIYKGEEERAIASKRVINKKGGVTYSIKRGDSWWKIAQKYGVSINELKEWNPQLANKGLLLGRKVKIYEASSESASVGTKPVRNEKQPATTSSLETKSQSDLLALENKPVENQSNIEQDKLSLPTALQVNKPIMPSSAKTDAQIYKVKSGDTLWDISKKFGVSIKEIKEWNNLTEASQIKPGKVLKLSQN